MFNESAESWRLIFVFGCGHSGTTLTASMLAAHSRCQLYSEETELFNLLHPKAAENLLRFGLRLVQDQGRDFLVEKTPRHVWQVPNLVEALPQSGRIGMVRDPRDTVASFLKGRNTTFEKALARWLSDNQKLQEARENGWVFVQRYEDLIADPEAACRGLCDYLGIAYDPAMLAFYKHAPEFYDRAKRGTHEARRNWQIHQPLSDHRGIYRNHLTDAQLAEVTRQADELMRYFGYAP